MTEPGHWLVSDGAPGSLHRVAVAKDRARSVDRVVHLRQGVVDPGARRSLTSAAYWARTSGIERARREVVRRQRPPRFDRALASREASHRLANERRGLADGALSSPSRIRRPRRSSDSDRGRSPAALCAPLQRVDGAVHARVVPRLRLEGHEVALQLQDEEPLELRVGARHGLSLAPVRPLARPRPPAAARVARAPAAARRPAAPAGPCCSRRRETP